MSRSDFHRAGGKGGPAPCTASPTGQRLRREAAFWAGHAPRWAEFVEFLKEEEEEEEEKIWFDFKELPAPSLKEKSRKPLCCVSLCVCGERVAICIKPWPWSEERGFWPLEEKKNTSPRPPSVGRRFNCI